MPGKYGPGVYRGIDDDVYHSDFCDRLSFSASDFHTLQSESAAHFFEGHWLNPQREERSKAVYSFGKAAHALVLGMPVFERQFAISPYDEFRTAESKDWRDVVAAGKTVLKQRDMDVVRGMENALRCTPQTSRAFVGGEAELTFVWEPSKALWEGSPIYFKSRPDWTPNTADGVALEYKTAASAHPDDWAKAFFEYGYDVQLAMMSEALKVKFGKPITVGHVVQEKEKPYVAQVYIATEKHLEIGRARLRRGAAMLEASLAAHLEGRPRHEAWPGYFTKPVQFDVPFWIEKKEQDNGSK